ncbi:divalent metal cation transporter [Mesorhizobium sp.]|uniref:divalent metal cation transporter n=1 Tax=Mesorhizobium sp. TaxID=1871066 RepID=UPI0025BB2EFB|nr:divalent metal cation transporter [Mesorhizobium sp.]
MAHIPWGEALKGIFILHVEWNGSFFTTFLAILGTTISHYLFFWQSSPEVEEEMANPKAKPLKCTIASIWRLPAYSRRHLGRYGIFEPDSYCDRRYNGRHLTPRRE